MSGGGGATVPETPQPAAVAQVTFAGDSDSDNDFAFLTTCDQGVVCGCDKEPAYAATAMINIINKKWLLLDSEATKHVFCNKKLIKDVKTSQTRITVHGHRESGTTRTYGHVPGIKYQVWIDEDGIANVLALCLIRQQYRVTYDNWNEACFFVHKNNGDKIMFKEHKNATVGVVRLTYMVTCPESRIEYGLTKTVSQTY